MQVDGLILLGGAGSQRKASQWRQPELNESGDRYLAFMALARQYPEAQLVFTGGAGGMLGQKFSEADMARQLFSDHGIDHERVLFEGKSRNTYENATLTKQLVDPAPGEHWLLVTSAWHMPRSVGVFCKADWPVIPYPVDHISNPDYLLRVDLGFAEHLWNLAFGLKEWVGLLIM
jgi:uncharacterized SAM-binding protein YcdF (DUF218 family)